MPEDAPWWQYLEDAGYAAGLAGEDIHMSKGWDEAFRMPHMNLPMYIMAGWIAGRAMRRIKKEIDPT